MTKQNQCLMLCVCVCLGSMYFCLDPNPRGDISLVGGQPILPPLCVAVLQALGSARKPRQALP